MNFRVDNLQYCNWSREIFEINHQAKLDAVHATICYHEDFDELQKNIEQWNVFFRENVDLIFPGKNSKDIEEAKNQNKTAIFYGQGLKISFPVHHLLPLDDLRSLPEFLRQSHLARVRSTRNRVPGLPQARPNRSQCA